MNAYVLADDISVPTTYARTYLSLQYVFLTMEAMVDAAVHLGFPRNVATRLVVNTIRVRYYL